MYKIKGLRKEDITKEWLGKQQSTIIKLLRTVDRSGIENLIKYLSESSYFTDPASGYYHANHIGGLAYHSLGVYKCLSNLVFLYKNECRGVTQQSLIISSLLHDLCKVGSYTLEYRNWKNPDTGEWERVLDYGFKPTSINLPHGVKSAYIANQYITLTKLEFEMISWHMGAYSESQANLKELNASISDNPAVMFLHQADMTHANLFELKFDKSDIPNPIDILGSTI